MHVISAQVLGQWNALTDEVVTQVIGGQTALFEVLMRRYNERVYRVARAIIRDDEEAEDVMQQAYVNAYATLSDRFFLLSCARSSSGQSRDCRTVRGKCSCYGKWKD